MKAERKMWEVKLSVPNKPALHATVMATDNLDAKAEASKQFYNHVFTGQFRFMAARIKK